MKGSAVVSVHSTNKSYMELSWDSTNGFDTDASFKFEPSLRLGNAQIFDNLTAGMRACLGLKLTVSDRELTSVEVCPELQAFLQRSNEPAVPAYPPELVASSRTPDMQLCFEFASFTTNADLDPLSRDEPYARGCFFGVCRYTDAIHFSGDTVLWQDGPLCIPARRSTLEQVPAVVDVHEEDVLWDDSYTAPREVLLTTACPDLAAGDCTQDLEMTSLVQGTTARLTVKFTIKALAPRRTEAAEPLRRTESTGSCTGTSYGISLGVHSTFGGFSYPATFKQGAGGERPVSRVEAPSFRPDSPQTGCIDGTRLESGLVVSGVVVATSWWPVLTTLIVCQAFHLQHQSLSS